MVRRIFTESFKKSENIVRSSDTAQNQFGHSMHTNRCDYAYASWLFAAEPSLFVPKIYKTKILNKCKQSSKAKFCSIKE
jgi:hypothetical protein